MELGCDGLSAKYVCSILTQVTQRRNWNKCETHHRRCPTPSPMLLWATFSVPHLAPAPLASFLFFKCTQLVLTSSGLCMCCSLCLRCSSQFTCLAPSHPSDLSFSAVLQEASLTRKDTPPQPLAFSATAAPCWFLLKCFAINH